MREGRRPFGAKVEELPVVGRVLARVRRRELRREKSTKGTMEALNAYTTRYRDLKVQLEGGLPVESDEHRGLSQLFHRLSPAQQRELKGRSPGCLFAREGQGPDGHY